MTQIQMVDLSFEKPQIYPLSQDSINFMEGQLTLHAKLSTLIRIGDLNWAIVKGFTNVQVISSKGIVLFFLERCYVYKSTSFIFTVSIIYLH